MEIQTYDVIVIGGGTAGVPAAVQAARAGAKTLIVEKNGIFGGTITSGGVNFPGKFFAWEKQVIAGIGWELVTQCEHYTRNGGHTRVNAALYACACDAAVIDSGCHVLMHTMVASVSQKDDMWDVVLCTKEGLIDVKGKIVIDCTGDANAAAFAGVEVTYPEEGRQPNTLTCHVSGYDFESLDIDAINKAFAEEVEKGTMELTDGSWRVDKPDVGHWLRSHGKNANHTDYENAATSEGKTGLEIKARAQLLRLYNFLKQQPGLEDLTIDSVCPECGVRETAVIKGRFTITEADYKAGKTWDDSLCHAFYHIDLHQHGEEFVKEHMKEGIVPTIPRGALLPEGVDNFIVAGRILSSDRLANSALRVEAPCMAMGQAAGAMAALAVEKNLEPGDLDIKDIHDLLRKNGAIVPGDVKFDESNFTSNQ